MKKTILLSLAALALLTTGCASTPDALTAKATKEVNMQTSSVYFEYAMNEEQTKLYASSLLRALGTSNVELVDKDRAQEIITLDLVYVGPYSVYDQKKRTEAPLQAKSISELEIEVAANTSTYSTEDNIRKTFKYGMTVESIVVGTIYSAATDALLDTNAYQMVTDVYTSKGRTRIFADVFDDDIEANEALIALSDSTADKIVSMLNKKGTK